ncbi:MFS transporter [Lujinxingia vulgaris]|uniref:MFS transporter n=1 Tax=Lujinxingia vulgaris TaxID=2600176 RepID=A0A5C6X0Y5_9DELT|nr:MFS transporter [Lujinxingia vulgaris]TXD31868.1 MFS transporter [Lujinxingia vulgaris]
MTSLPNAEDEFGGARAGSLALIYATSLATVLIFTYLPRHFEALGLSGAMIGTIFAARTIAQSIASPLWATLADRHDRLTATTRALLVSGVVAVIALPFVSAPLALFGVLVAYALTAGCALPLIDALTLRAAGAEGFSRLRAFGSAGFGVAALGAAALGLSYTHAEIAAMTPWALVIATALTALATLGLPPGERRRARPRPDWSLFKELWRAPLVVIFAIAALHWASQMPYNLFLVFLCEERDFPAWSPGLAVGVGIAAEIVAFAMAPRLLKRINPLPLFALSIVLTALRWFITAYVTSLPVILAAQLGHAFSYGAFYVAMMAILDRRIPPEVRATGQGALYLVVFGLGGALGAGLGGWLLDVAPASRTFAAAGWLELAAFIGLVTAWRWLHRGPTTFLRHA